MRLEVIQRDLPSGRVLTTLVNQRTRKYVAQLGEFDSVFNAQHIADAVNMYADLLDLGLLKPVLTALEKRKTEQQK